MKVAKQFNKLVKLALFGGWLAFVGLWSVGFTQTNMLRYATVGEPPSLDQQVITSDLATTIAQHLFEGLYTFDSAYAPQPMLAEGERISRNGKVITIRLRKGVKFHNGKEMTSADVVASLDRWGEFGSRGKLLYDNIASVKTRGDYVVILTFNTVFGPWKNLLAFINGGPVIYPEEIAKNAGKQPLEVDAYIGTGPYQMGTWRAGNYLEITKFAAYKARSDKSDGYAGARTANFETIRFIPVPDPNTRISGVKAGDYDYAEQIPGDLFVSLKNDASVKVLVNEGAIFGLIFVNSRHGMFKDNYKLRQALITAIDMQPALKAAIGDEKLWASNSSFMPKTSTWYSEAGKAVYSQGDAELAKTLAKAAGYDKTPVKFMVSTAYTMHYDKAIVIVKQLAEAGFEVDLKVYDWATLISKRGKPEEWDLFFTHHGFVPDPILISVMNDNYPGWWATEKKTALKNAFVSTTDPKKRKQIWDQLQALIYEEIPTMKTGDVFTYNIASPKLIGLRETSLIWPKFWGVTKH